jgi:PLP dependent protein
MIAYEEFLIRLQAVRTQIGDACQSAGRDPAGVALLAVTKTHPAAAADYAARAGLTAVGENRVQEAVEKKPLTAATSLRWELIGHLQSNKAKLAAQTFDRVQSVDSEKLLTHLDRAAGELGRPLAVLLQINAGQDPAKFGAEPADAPRLLEIALGKNNLRIDGLMTIAPLSDDPAVAARTFANLRTIRDDLAARFGHPLRELSMGMSGDLPAAIAAGSTVVRVGTALFGTRPPLA